MYQTYYEPSGALMSLIKKVNPQGSMNIESQRRRSSISSVPLADPRFLQKQFTVVDTSHGILNPVGVVSGAQANHLLSQRSNNVGLETIKSEELTSRDNSHLANMNSSSTSIDKKSSNNNEQ